MNKLAIPASMYQYMPVHDMITGFSKELTVLLGHNRHATKGASDNPAFAHPFKHGHITLVHNGSLTTHFALTKERFTVDSEAITKAFEVDGPEAVIPKLNGAFALVWIDQKEKTLNFVRNSQRPFAIAWNQEQKSIYWASEKGMLEGFLGRSTSVFNDNSIPYDECQELPVGEWWSFPIEEGEVDIEKVVKKDIKVHVPYAAPARQGKAQATTTTTTTTTGLGMTSGDGTDKKLDRSRSEFVGKRLDNLGRTFVGTRTFIEACDDKQTYLEDPLGIYLKSFTQYSSTVTGTGTVTAQMIEFPYAEVVIYGVSKAKFNIIQEQHFGLAQVFLTSINTPSNLRARHNIGEDDLKKFEVVGNQTTLRELEEEDYDLYKFDVEQAPDEYKLVSALEAYLEENFIDLDEEDEEEKK